MFDISCSMFDILYSFAARAPAPKGARHTITLTPADAKRYGGKPALRTR